MKNLIIIALFIASVFVDGIFLPALFGLRESFLFFIFLIFLLSGREIETRSIVFGLIFSSIVEFYFGVGVGTLVLPFLVATFFLMVLKKFLNVRSTLPAVIFGAFALLVFWKTSNFFNMIF